MLLNYIANHILPSIYLKDRDLLVPPLHMSKIHPLHHITTSNLATSTSTTRKPEFHGAKQPRKWATASNVMNSHKQQSTANIFPTSIGAKDLNKYKTSNTILWWLRLFRYDLQLSNAVMRGINHHHDYSYFHDGCSSFLS